MGKMIRLITDSFYNHISFAFHSDLSDLMSFSRYYYQIPLYGGFTFEYEESHIQNHQVSEIKVFKCKVDRETYFELKRFVWKMRRNPKAYRYNLLGAALHPIKKQVHLPDCYTCEEFVNQILKIAKITKMNEYLTIEDICLRLIKDCIYVGPINEYTKNLMTNPDFYADFSLLQKIKLTGSGMLYLYLKYQLSKKENRKF